jgi:hypothetical protein
MGKRGWLERLIKDEYIPTIASLDNSPQGRAKAQNFGATIRGDWVQRGFTTLEQQQSLMDQTRSAIKAEFGKNHFSVEVIDFSRDEYFELNTKKQENARNHQLHQQYIKNPDAIVAQAVRLLDSPEWADVAAGLAVLTGRRLNEVLKTAQFTIQSQWVVRFSGALKRRGEPVPLIFDIPTLTTAKRVVEATKKLRQITPANANEAKVAQASDRHFHSLVPAPVGKGNLYAHLWRSLYCCIATFWYCPKHVDDLLFKAHIMGHFETLTTKEQTNGSVLKQRLETFASQRHYRLYEIDDELIAYHNGKRKGIKLGIGGIQPLDAFADGLPENQPQPMRRKRPSGFRFWRDDHDSLITILNHFDGKTQPDKVSAWIHWSLNHLAQEQATAKEKASVSPPEDAYQENTHQEDYQDRNQNQIQNQAIADAVAESQKEERQELSQAILYTQAVHSPEPVATSPQQPVISGLEAKLDKLLDVMALFVQAQTQEKAKSKNWAIAPASHTPSTTPQPQSFNGEVPGGDSLQRSRPRKYKTGEATTTINAAINAIIQHNDQPGLPHNDKWAITINGLKNFSTNQRAIERIMFERKDEIANHHSKHQLQPRHNDRHKRKHKINDVIQL